jgi:pimeloyl-ACP methyl ester carboxylesterase
MKAIIRRDGSMENLVPMTAGQVGPVAAANPHASPTLTETTHRIGVDGIELAGTLAVPADVPRPPAVLLIGGTLSDTRDGDLDPGFRPGVPPHGMYRRLAHGLAEAGIASFRFDRRGCGESTGSRPDRAREIDDAAAVWDWLGLRHELAGAQAMVGESAGAYVLCRLAEGGRAPGVAVLQGALFRSIPEMIGWNYGRARDFVARGPAEKAWLERESPAEFANAMLIDAMLTAIAEGQSVARVERDGRKFERSLDGLAYDLEYVPADQFQHIRCPTLVVHGGEDLNVPVQDAFATIQSLWQSGNRSVDLTILAGADHSFQLVPEDPEERLRDRLTLRCFLRPYHMAYPGVIVDFLVRQLLGSPGHAS